MFIYEEAGLYMKEWNKSILAGCICIAISIVAAGNFVGRVIANNLGNASSHVPSAITVYSDAQDLTASDYMSVYEAAQYCRIDFDSFEKLLTDGKLIGTYAEIPVEKLVPDEEAFNDIQLQIPDGAPEPAFPLMAVPGISQVFVRAKLDEWMLAQVVS